MEVTELAGLWVKLHKLPKDSVEAKSLDWFIIEVCDLSNDFPLKCFDFILEVLRQTDDEWVLTNLAAGPLESMLGRHPEEGLALLEQELPHNPKLKSILINVWQNLMPDDAWKRFKKLRGDNPE